MFKPKTSTTKGNMIYKTLYINETIVQNLEFYANIYNISVNSMITQMIEYCLNDMKK